MGGKSTLEESSVGLCPGRIGKLVEIASLDMHKLPGGIGKAVAILSFGDGERTAGHKSEMVFPFGGCTQLEA
jgi:hypothetical protein